MSRPVLAFLVGLAILVASLPRSASAQGVAEYQEAYEPRPLAEPPASAGPDAPKSQPPTQGFDVPAPTIITQPNFKSETSTGAAIRGEPVPLTDHKLYAIDTYYFCQKVRDGMTKTEANEDLKSLLKDLQSAMNDYDAAEGTIHYEEQTTVGKPVRLDENPNPKGTELREQMKRAITQMSEIRGKIESQFGSVLQAGRLPEEQ